MTITTPAGNKVRSQSKRRFLVVRDFKSSDGAGIGADVVKRTDNLDTARTLVRRQVHVHNPDWVMALVILDQRTGEAVR